MNRYIFIYKNFQHHNDTIQGENSSGGGGSKIWSGEEFPWLKLFQPRALLGLRFAKKNLIKEIHLQDLVHVTFLPE